MKFQANSKSEFRSETTKPEKGSGRHQSEAPRGSNRAQRLSNKPPAEAPADGLHDIRQPTKKKDEGGKRATALLPADVSPSVAQKAGPIPGECSYLLNSVVAILVMPMIVGEME